VFQALGAAMLKARSPNLSRDRGRNKSTFDADLRTVGYLQADVRATMLGRFSPVQN